MHTTGSPLGRVVAVVPTFNRVAYLPEAIQSILDQTRPPTKILVVDDGSTDGTADAVSAFGSRVDYLRKENGGKSSALNLALRSFGEELVWIFDDDDIAAPEALERMQAALAVAPEAGFAFGSYVIFEDDNGRRRMIDADFPSVDPDELSIALLQRCFVHQPGLLVRRACYDEVGLFDETLRRSQDYDMMLRLSRSFRGIEVQGPVFFQRRHAGVRGTTGYAVRASDVEATWKRYDKIIMRRVWDSWALGDFLPRRPVSETLTQRQRFSALLERCVAMGHSGLWDLAADDLREVATTARLGIIQSLTPAEARTAARLFDLWSAGAANFRDAKAFRRELGNVSPARLGREMRVHMSAGLPYRIRSALTDGAFAKAAGLAEAYVRIAPPRVMAASILGKLRGKIASRVGRLFRRGRPQPPSPVARDASESRTKAK